jgi:hypothetical protein
MTHIVEQKSLRYTWELVRHTYIVDLENEIEIRQVGISPSHETRILDPPYPFTSFFEIEIDQIQKNGTTVFSLRNICPVEINRKPGLNLLNSLVKSGSSRVTRRFQSQEGETETRWLYTDDFFLISASSGDRHDLSMLLSLILGKLNMIALSIQSGRRIHSELENQQKFRAAMNTMFSEGVDGAFREVPVYLQHGDMTDSEIDMSAALMSAELQDLTATLASDEEGSAAKIPVAHSTPVWPVTEEENIPAERTLTESAVAEQATCENIPEVNPPESVTGTGTLAEIIPEDSSQTDDSTGSTLLAESPPEDSTRKSLIPEENTRIEIIPECRCSSCGSEIPGTKKFCGNCGAEVSVSSPQERAPDFSRIATGSGCDPSPSRSRSAAEPAVNLKSIEELEDLSWLSD